MRCASCCARRRQTARGRKPRCGCASPTPHSSATSDRSTTPLSPSRSIRRPAKNARSIGARTSHPSPTTPIAGWWPASRTTTSRAGSPAWARSFATASSRPRRRPVIASAADALAVTLDETGRVDPEHLAELLECDPDTALSQLGAAVFRNPLTEAWETTDAYLSGPVRTKLAAAEAATALERQYERNVAALREVQPRDIRPSDITARLGAPWLPTDVIEAFAAEIMGKQVRIWHTVEIASWSVEGSGFAGTAAGTSEWGTPRRHAGLLLHDALNSATPQIYDTVIEDGVERRVLIIEATEAAKEKLGQIKQAFTQWVWTEPDRADRLARIYNDRFNK